MKFYNMDFVAFCVIYAGVLLGAIRLARFRRTRELGRSVMAGLVGLSLAIRKEGRNRRDHAR